MKQRVLLAVRTNRFNMILPPKLMQKLEAEYDVLDGPFPEGTEDESLLRRIGDADIVITSWLTPQLTGELIAEATALKLVAHAAGSVRPIVSDALWNRGIRVTSAARAIADGVAEFCLGLTLTCTKRAFWFAAQIREGQWSKEHDLFGPPFEIYRQNVGLIGAGYVGRKFIELLSPFSCNILLFDPYCEQSSADALGVEKVDSLDELFERSRVVSLHAPVTDETRGMVRGSHFAKLQTGSLFINTARGVIVREKEMIEELAKGRFVACLDVTDPEPPALDSPLRRLPNVILTPHEAGSIRENLMRIGELVLEQLHAFSTDQAIDGEVTKDRLETMA